MVRLFAHFSSVLFHPLFVITYGLLMLLLVNPYAFGVPNVASQSELVLRVFMQSFFLPAFGVFMMKMIGFADSLELKTRQERIGPYILTGVMYLWLYVNLRENPEVPYLFKSFVLGSCIALFLAFFINNFSKISAHTVGIGGMLGLTILMIIDFYSGEVVFTAFNSIVTMHTTHFLIFAILACGIVGSSRLWLNAHEPSEVYGGYLVGFGAQIVAYQFYANA